MTANDVRLKAVTLLLVTGTLLGLSTNLSKVAHNVGIAPLQFLMWSCGLAGGLLLIFAIRQRDLPDSTAPTAEYLVCAAILSTAAPNLIFFSAVPHVGVSFLILLLTLPPAITYMGALVLGIERFNTWRLIGVGIAMSGAVVIVSRTFAVPDAPAVWIWASLAAPLLLAMGNLYRTRRWPPGATPESLAPAMLLTAAGLLSLWALLSRQSFGVPLRFDAIGLVMAQSVVFALQFLFFFRLQRTAGPVYLSLLGTVSALSGIPFAVVLLGEKLPPGLVVGGGLIAVGIAILTAIAARQSNKA